MQEIISKCLYNHVTDVPNVKNIEAYQGLINPINLSFSLDANAIYTIIGCKIWNSTAWVYILPKNAKWSDLIDIVPVVLFDFNMNIIPKNWVMRIDPEDKKIIEILPNFLAAIPNWFERYTDEDPEVLEIINKKFKLGEYSVSDDQQASMD